MPVYMIGNHDFPTVYIMGYIETGRLVENAENPGIRIFTNSMLARGTAKHTYEELLEERSFIPYQFDVSQSWNKIVFAGYSLTQDVDKMLRGTFEILSEPTFPEEEMDKVRPRLISNAKNFKKTETGGSCLPGCHIKKDYDRDNPVDYSIPRLPKKAVPKPKADEGAKPADAGEEKKAGER